MWDDYIVSSTVPDVAHCRIMIEDLQSRLTYALDARKMSNVSMRSADGNND